MRGMMTHKAGCDVEQIEFWSTKLCVFERRLQVFLGLDCKDFDQYRSTTSGISMINISETLYHS